MNDGLQPATVWSLAIDPNVHTTLYAGTNLQGTSGQIFKTLDGGDTWTFAFDTSPVLALAIDPFNTSQIYAGTVDYLTGLRRNAVLKSTDEGKTWSPILSAQVLALAADSSFPNNLYVGTDNGLYRTANGGDTWDALGFTGQQIRALAVDPNDPAIILAGLLYPGGVSRSSDYGDSWEALVGIPAPLTVGTFGISPAASSVVFAGTGGGAFRFGGPIANAPRIELICRPIDPGRGFLAQYTPLIARHCYLLSTDADGRQNTYGAYSDRAMLTPKKNAPSAFPDGVPYLPGGCGNSVLSTECIDVPILKSQSFGSIINDIEQAILAGPDGKYDNTDNNSNAWIQRRIDASHLAVALPADVIANEEDLCRLIGYLSDTLRAFGVPLYKQVILVFFGFGACVV